MVVSYRVVKLGGSASDGEKNLLRISQRNRCRDWETRAGTVELRIPSRRKCSWFPSFLEPYRLALRETKEPPRRPGPRGGQLR